MAILDRQPYPLPKPPERFNDAAFKKYQQDQDEAFQKLVERSNTLPEGEIIGALVRWQVADGYAHYLVTKARPLTLQHVPYSDGYNVGAETIRGVTRATVLAQLKQAKAWARIGEKSDNFYDTLQPGQIVHYHHSFGAYVRCEVTPERQLKPLSLVGKWSELDLPRRQPDGSIYTPPAVEVLLGKRREPWRPHASNVYEAPGFSDRYDIDPRQLQPIDLTVPPITPEQEAEATLWRKVNALRTELEVRGDRPPQAIIDAVQAILNVP